MRPLLPADGEKGFSKRKVIYFSALSTHLYIYIHLFFLALFIYVFNINQNGSPSEACCHAYCILRAAEIVTENWKKNISNGGSRQSDAGLRLFKLQRRFKELDWMF